MVFGYMVFLAIWSIFAGPDVDHISGTECMYKETPSPGAEKSSLMPSSRKKNKFGLFVRVILLIHRLTQAET